jgi:hypothetical protein
MDGCGKSCLHLDSIPGTLQPVASRYTDWATPAHKIFAVASLNAHKFKTAQTHVLQGIMLKHLRTAANSSVTSTLQACQLARTFPLPHEFSWSLHLGVVYWGVQTVAGRIRKHFMSNKFQWKSRCLREDNNKTWRHGAQRAKRTGNGCLNTAKWQNPTS